MSLATTEHSQCPDCGAHVQGGRTGCQLLYDEIAVAAYQDLQYASVRDLAFDTYCMQHVERYCVSAKSYAAHLTRLCCGIEYAGESKVYAAINRWLGRNPKLVKPDLLSHRGDMTIVDIRTAHRGAEHISLVHHWSQDVWHAYLSQHELARSWILLSLA